MPVSTSSGVRVGTVNEIAVPLPKVLAAQIAPMTRCISMVGRVRSSIRLLTDSMLPDQPWFQPPSTARCDSLPCLPPHPSIPAACGRRSPTP